MDYNFAAQQDFIEALTEIDILIDLAKESEDEDETKYTLFLKSGLLFLATKFESFLEEIASEYLFKLGELRLPLERLPDGVIFAVLNYYLSDELIAQVRQKKEKCKNTLGNIVPFITDGTVIESIDIENKFSYGKHGTAEVKKLFERIGHSDIFDHCKVTRPTESMLSDEEMEVEIDIAGQINAITGIRNGIIHENKSPNLTVDQLCEYKENIAKFVNIASAHLSVKLGNL